MFRLIPPPSAQADRSKKEKKYSEAIRDAAIAAAKTAKPKYYRLTGFKKPGQVNFVAFGCQGSGDANQKLVADMIREWLEANPDVELDFILLLGDNIYPEGAKSPRSRKFDTSFCEPYEELIKKYKIPFFAISGNHDHNMSYESYYLSAIQQRGPERLLAEVAYSYLPDERYDVASKIALYQKDTSDLIELNLRDHLPSWNMPLPHYPLDLDGLDTVIIALDSSAYLSDYLTKETNPAETNQALWLKNIVDTAEQTNKKCILALHHPVYSPGKRSFENDLRLYLSKDKRRALRKRFPHLNKKTASYNDYLAACFKEQGLTFALILSAHDHQLYYYNNGEIKQLTLGGGGGPLQNRYEFTQPLSCFIKDFGFGSVHIEKEKPESIEFAIHTQRNRHFLFSNTSKLPQKTQADSAKVAKLKEAISLAVANYFGFMAEKQNEERTNFIEWNKKHGHKDNNLVHEAWALTTEDKAHTFEELTFALESIVSKTSQSAEHSFKHYLAAALSDSQDEEIANLLGDQGRKSMCGLQ